MTSQEPGPRREYKFSLFPEDARKHARAAREEMRLMVEALVPKPILDTERAVRREALRGVRRLLDGAIERLESQDKKTE